jgi:hypothetical protein
MEETKEEILVLDEGFDPSDGQNTVCCKGAVAPLKA